MNHVRLVYEVGACGSVEGLLKDSILNTKVLGHREVKRISDIVHLDGMQRFVIRWLCGPYAGSLAGEETGCVKTFADYETAVEHEIEMVNTLRRKGASFA